MNDDGGNKDGPNTALPLIETLDEIRQGASHAFAEVRQAWAEIRTYRYLLAFEVKQMIKATFARVVAMLVFAATVVELLASITHFPGFPHSDAAEQTALGSILAVCAVVGFWAHSVQTRANHDYVRLLRALRALSGEIGDLDFSNPTDRQQRRDAYLQKILASFNAAFGQTMAKEFSTYAGILWPQENGDLLRICQDPYCDYNPKGVLPTGGGAGGCAAVTGSMIYVPKVSHYHGIQITDQQSTPPRRIMTLRKNVFHQFGETVPPFQSLLCVPFSVKSTNSAGRRRGVLYIGGAKIGVLSTEFHLDAAQLEASFIASVLEKYFDEDVQ
jgi:hypothetical protein